MTRQGHLDWCKKRALEYVETGDYQQAIISMMSDLGKHPETQGHPGAQLGMGLMMTGKLSDRSSVEEFINGFN